MTSPVRLDASKGPMVVRKIVVWRRLEPGDVRTPGTELAPESPHLEAKVVQIGIGEDTWADCQRLWKRRDEITAVSASWTTRYEPAGALLTLGGTGVVAVLLDYLPDALLWYLASLAGLGVGVGALTRARRARTEKSAAAAWQKTDERRELERLQKILTPRWERFAERTKDDAGFRTDVRVGDVHDAERLVSIDVERITHPDTWRPDEKRDEVRYGWVYRDGRYSEQVAELEDSDVPSSDEEE